jgi:hypothetical protein
LNSSQKPSEHLFGMAVDDEFFDGFLRRVANGVLVGPLSDGRDGSALHIAARAGNASACRRLVELGADIWMLDRAQELPIHRAAAAGRLDVCKLLLDCAGEERQKMLEFRAGSCNTPFVEAVTYGRLELVAYFVLECGEDPQQKTVITNDRLSSTRNIRAMDAVEDLLQSLATELSIAPHIGPAVASSVGARIVPACPGML